MSPVVSVLTPCFNQGHFLPDAVASALSAMRVAGIEGEIIVVDDGSTDQSGRIAEESARQDPERIQILHQDNQGQAVARQAAFEVSSGEFIIMLDADDALAPYMIRRCMGMFEQYAGAAVVVADAWMVAPDGRTRLRQHHQHRIVGWPDVLAYNPYGALAATITRRSAIESVGGLAVEGPAGCEDWDLWVRLTRCGYEFQGVPAPVAFYRQSAGGYSRRLLTMLEASMNVLERAAAEDPRLDGCETTAAPIGAEQFSRYVNGRIFHTLGQAVGAGCGQREMEAILERLQDCEPAVDYWREQYQWGLHGALEIREPEVRSPVAAWNGVKERVERALQRGGEIGGGHDLVDQLETITESARQKPSIFRRIAGKIFGG